MQRINLIIMISIAVLAGLIAASYDPYLGIAVLLIILVFTTITVPPAWRRMYLLTLPILLIGLPISVTVRAFLDSLTGTDVPFIYSVGTFLAAVGVGLAIASLIAFGLIGIVVWVAAHWTTVIAADLNLGAGIIRGHLFRSLLGINSAFTIVENARIALAKPGGLFPSLGGGILIIRPGSAVVTEYGGAIRRALEPGFHRTIQFEQIRHMIDLTPQQDDLPFKDVRTADGIPLSGVLRIQYQITPNQVVAQPGFGADPNEITGGPHPVYRHALARCIYQSRGYDWKQQTRNEVLNQLSNIVGQRHLPEIYDDPANPVSPATGFADLATAIADGAAAAALQWAVQITQVQVLHLTAPEELKSNAVIPWQINTESQLDERETTSMAAYNAQQILFQNQMQASLLAFQNALAGTNAPEHTQERMIGLMAQVLKTMAENRHTAFRYFQILEALSEHPDTKVVLIPDDKGKPINL